MIVAALCNTGCGVIIQTIMGWGSEHVERRTEQHSVAVSSVPPNAEILRRGPGAPDELAIGRAPLTDTVPFQVEVTLESPRVGGVVVGGLIELGGGIALIATSGGAENPATIVLGAYAVIFGVSELIVALIYGFSGDSIKGRKTLDSTRDYVYTAKLTGFPDQALSVRIPDQGRVELVLGGAQGGSGSPVAQKTEPAKRSIQTWVIAIMNVEDVNADRKAEALDPSLLKNLGDQLRIFIAQQGVRTIDRGAQDKILREQITAMKSESFKECYDDSCQIELGKALAASHILRARVTRFGKRCVLNSELIDLRAEVTVAASSSQGDCGAEGFLGMSEDVAKKLLASAD